jgi:ferredoxin
MRISVNERKCQGHGLCAMSAPQMFDIGESDGYAYSLVDEVPVDQEGAARQAAGRCPERAIQITE